MNFVAVSLQRLPLCGKQANFSITSGVVPHPPEQRRAFFVLFYPCESTGFILKSPCFDCCQRKGQVWEGCPHKQHGIIFCQSANRKILDFLKCHCWIMLCDMFLRFVTPRRKRPRGICIDNFVFLVCIEYVCNHFSPHPIKTAIQNRHHQSAQNQQREDYSRLAVRSCCRRMFPFCCHQNKRYQQRFRRFCVCCRPCPSNF